MKKQKQTSRQKSAKELKLLLELKNRDLEIEAALERVRSRSMAMHESSELQEVIGVVFDQLLQLGMEMDAAQIDTYEKGSEDLNVWVANELQPYGRRINIPNFDHPMILDYLKARNEGLVEFSATYSKEDKNSFYAVAFKNSDLKDIPEERKEKMLAGDGLGIYSAFVGQTSIQLLNFDGKEYDVEECRIVKRFAEVFQQTYTRFLDLQKAEAQAREAQIETALEKVRSRTMAMHHSNELAEVIAELSSQLAICGIPVENTVILTDFDLSNKNNLFSMWLTMPDFSFPNKFEYPYLDHPIMNSFIEVCEKGGGFYTERLSKDEKDKFFELAFKFSGLKNFSRSRKDLVFSADNWTRSIMVNKYSSLIMERFNDQEFSSEDNEILKRFGNVFEQTYTRFLDLQKAETQAREAQIEVALERVRARTMAMQKSEELGEVAVILYKELNALGVRDNMNCGYVEIDTKAKIQHGWMTKMGEDFVESLTLPLVGDPVFDSRFKAWKSKKVLFYQKVQGQELKSHKAFTTPQIGSNEWAKISQELPDPTYFYCANFAQGYLHIVTGSALVKEEEELLARFTRVFEMTYSRFLDLKKADAQAREAQIEVA